MQTSLQLPVMIRLSVTTQLLQLSSFHLQVVQETTLTNGTRMALQLKMAQALLISLKHSWLLLNSTVK